MVIHSFPFFLDLSKNALPSMSESLCGRLESKDGVEDLSTKSNSRSESPSAISIQIEKEKVALEELIKQKNQETEELNTIRKRKQQELLELKQILDQKRNYTEELEDCKQFRRNILKEQQQQQQVSTTPPTNQVVKTPTPSPQRRLQSPRPVAPPTPPAYKHYSQPQQQQHQQHQQQTVGTIHSSRPVVSRPSPSPNHQSWNNKGGQEVFHQSRHPPDATAASFATTVAQTWAAAQNPHAAVAAFYTANSAGANLAAVSAAARHASLKQQQQLQQQQQQQLQQQQQHQQQQQQHQHQHHQNVSSDAICEGCKKEANFMCSACRGAHYCSLECQVTY